MQDGYDQTLHGLLRKRAELASDVETHRVAWEAAGAAMDAIDRAILVFNPALRGVDLPTRRAAPAYASQGSEIQRLLLDHLRRSGQPVRTLEAAAVVMTANGINAQDKVAATMIRKRCGDVLSKLRLRGIVTAGKYGSGSELEWRLVQV